MAAGGHTLVGFFHADETVFYFNDLDEDLQDDSFRLCFVSLKWIKSKRNKFLILDKSGELRARNLSVDERECHPEHKFNVKYYKNSDSVGRTGVSLYVLKGDRKLTVCCNNRLEVHPGEMDVSENVAGKAHQALFYLSEVASSCYLLESSLYPSMFLAFEPDEDDHTLSKLVLRRKELEEVDESCYITML